MSDTVSCSKCLEKVSEDKLKTFFDVTDFTEFQLNRMKDIGCILFINNIFLFTVYLFCLASYTKHVNIFYQFFRPRCL